MLTDFIAQLRLWDDLASAQDPPIRFDDLLTTLPMALPSDFPHNEAEALISRARAEVPTRFDSDINS